jgi:molybdenum cofactor cytidylyltransferase
MNNPSAIVLAAGTSSRMGAPNKLLLDFDGIPLVRHVVTRIVASEPFETIVVTGHQYVDVKNALTGLNVTFVHNPDFEQGMTSSIKAGVAIAKGTGFMICLSDMYALPSVRYRELMEFFLAKLTKDDFSICLPFYKGERGNPVVFSSAFREAILRHAEPEGCRKIVQDNAEHLYKLNITSSEILQDLDTPDDYQQARNNVAKAD